MRSRCAGCDGPYIYCDACEPPKRAVLDYRRLFVALLCMHACAAHAFAICQVHYEGSFDDGTVFDSSREVGEPYEFLVGSARAVPGFSDAVAGLGVGQSRRHMLTPADAYGAPLTSAWGWRVRRSEQHQVLSTQARCFAIATASTLPAGQALAWVDNREPKQSCFFRKHVCTSVHGVDR